MPPATFTLPPHVLEGMERGHAAEVQDHGGRTRLVRVATALVAGFPLDETARAGNQARIESFVGRLDGADLSRFGLEPAPDGTDRLYVAPRLWSAAREEDGSLGLYEADGAGFPFLRRAGPGEGEGKVIDYAVAIAGNADNLASTLYHEVFHNFRATGRIHDEEIAGLLHPEDIERFDRFVGLGAYDPSHRPEERPAYLVGAAAGLLPDGRTAGFGLEIGGEKRLAQDVAAWARAHRLEVQPEGLSRLFQAVWVDAPDRPRSQDAIDRAAVFLCGDNPQTVLLGPPDDALAREAGRSPYHVQLSAQRTGPFTDATFSGPAAPRIMPRANTADSPIDRALYRLELATGSDSPERLVARLAARAQPSLFSGLAAGSDRTIRNSPVFPWARTIVAEDLDAIMRTRQAISALRAHAAHGPAASPVRPGPSTPPLKPPRGRGGGVEL